MKQQRTLTYFISSLILLLLCVSVHAQNDSTVKDSIIIKEKYGLRVGGDIGKLIRSFADDDYSGFEVMADYRLKKRLYIAGEIGFEEKNTITDYTFSQNLNSFTVYTTDQYWEPQFTSNDLKEFNGLTALWVELILGMKVELFNNLFLGLNVQLKIMASETEPDNFGNVYVPGFNKTFDSSGIGVGYGYTMSYRIPLYKKDK